VPRAGLRAAAPQFLVLRQREASEALGTWKLPRARQLTKRTKTLCSFQNKKTKTLLWKNVKPGAPRRNCGQEHLIPLAFRFYSPSPHPQRLLPFPQRTLPRRLGQNHPERTTLSESPLHGGRARVGGVGCQSLLPCHGRPSRYCCGFCPVVNFVIQDCSLPAAVRCLRDDGILGFPGVRSAVVSPYSYRLLVYCVAINPFGLPIHLDSVFQTPSL
jgi:hypothetical protein